MKHIHWLSDIYSSVAYHKATKMASFKEKEDSEARARSKVKSNTPGDSGKTATFTSQGMKQLAVIFCDLERCPYSPKGKVYQAYLDLYS